MEYHGISWDKGINYPHGLGFPQQTPPPKSQARVSFWNDP